MLDELDKRVAGDIEHSSEAIGVQLNFPLECVCRVVLATAS